MVIVAPTRARYGIQLVASVRLVAVSRDCRTGECEWGPDISNDSDGGRMPAACGLRIIQ